MQTRHFLSLDQYSDADLNEMLELSIKLKSEQKAGRGKPLLAGKALAMIFQKPSNRTRVSFEMGMYQLGGKAINVRPNEINLGVREPAKDVARVMSRYVDIIMMRVRDHRDLVEYAEYSSIPVINGLCDLYHPCQALSDILTIKEQKKKLEGLNFCYIGDGNNVCNSLIHACKAFGLKMTVSCPEGYEPTLSQEKWPYQIIHNPDQAIAGADVVYTDVWTSMGQEAETKIRLKKFKAYKITLDLFSKAKADAIFMHCLPAHRDEEVSDEVAEHPHSVIFDQAENRLHAQKAIMVRLLGK